MSDTLELQAGMEQQNVQEPASAKLKRDVLLLALLMILLLAVRITWGVTRDVVVENEGAEYIRIAVNLASGHGYVGTMSGPELVFPPLYPVPREHDLAEAIKASLDARLLPLNFKSPLTVYEWDETRAKGNGPQ